MNKYIAASEKIYLGKNVIYCWVTKSFKESQKDLNLMSEYDEISITLYNILKTLLVVLYHIFNGSFVLCKVQFQYHSLKLFKRSFESFAYTPFVGLYKNTHGKMIFA